MASKEHIELSNFIRSFHENLRKQTKLLGAENAWDQHCHDERSLKKYAEAMHDLATNHWDKMYFGDRVAMSRVDWAYNACYDYFMKGQLLEQREKEQEICIKIGLSYSSIEGHTIPPWKLLDVGSCYNPFHSYSCFDTLAVDIAPATKNVAKCDFLNLKVVNDYVEETSSDIRELQKNSFHIVIFSLLLEYIPSPSQRLLCCEKAYELLKPEGVLVIITPDSNHVGANAKYMKSWRHILARLGFSRIKYEKLPHLHCMMFRKSIDKRVTVRWANLHSKDDVFDAFFIPQDFKTVDDSKNTESCTQCNSDDTFIDMKNELPFYIDD